MTDEKVLIDMVIQAMDPDMGDYSDDSQFHHWMEYACELDEIVLVNYRGDDLIGYLNKRMRDYTSNTPVHHACVDVASTLESVMPSTFKGVFKYA